MESRSGSEQFNADLDFCLKTKAALSDINKKRCTQFSYLKPKQFDCVKRALLADTLIVLPTGFGKSLIYELVQIISGKKVIIISPINAIINEQLDRLGDAAIKLDMGVVKQTEQDNTGTVCCKIVLCIHLIWSITYFSIIWSTSSCPRGHQLSRSFCTSAQCDLSLSLALYGF